MARSMEITLKTTGLDAAAALLDRIAGASDRFNKVLDQVQQRSKHLPSPALLNRIGGSADTAAGKVDRLTASLEKLGAVNARLNAANAPEILTRSQPASEVLDRVKQVRPDAVDAVTSGREAHAAKVAQGTAGKLKDAESALASLEAAGTGTAEELHDARAKIARFRQALEREEKLLFVGPQAPKVTAPQFAAGPEQKLLDLMKQREEASQLPSGAQKAAVMKDLERAERLAQRQQHLELKRAQNAEYSRTRPELLDVLDDLLGGFRDFTRGDLGSVVNRASRRIGFIQPGSPGTNEREGGLNIEQLIARAGGPKALQNQLAGPKISTGLSSQPSVSTATNATKPPPTAAALARAGMVAGHIAAAAGPVVLFTAGVVAASAALRSMQRSVGEATDRFQRMGDAGALSGGTSSNIARLTARGFSPEQIPDISASLRQRLGQDPFAIMAGKEIGVGFQVGRQFGGQNEAQLTLQVTDALRRTYLKNLSVLGEVRAREEQLRQVRMLGAEAILPQLLLSERVIRAQERDAIVRGRIFNPRHTQAARDFNANLDRMNRNFELLGTAIKAKLINPVDDAASRIADITRDITFGVTNTGKLLRTIRTLIFGTDEEKAKLRRDFQADNQSASADPYLEAQREAVEKLARITEILLQQGRTGGGARATKAIPDRMRGWRADEEGRKERQRYGGITV